MKEHKSIVAILEEALDEGKIGEDTFQAAAEVLAKTMPIAGRPWIDFFDGREQDGGRILFTWDKAEHHFDTECGAVNEQAGDARIEHFYRNRETEMYWGQDVDEGCDPLDGEASVYLSRLSVHI